MSSFYALIIFQFFFLFLVGLLLLKAVSEYGVGGILSFFIVVMFISLAGEFYGVGSIIALSILVYLMLLLLSAFLRLACRMFAGFFPAKGTGFKASCWAFLVWVIALKLEDYYGHVVINGAVVGVLVVLCFLVQTAICYKVLKKPEVGMVRFRKACGISFVHSIFTVAALWMFLRMLGHVH